MPRSVDEVMHVDGLRAALGPQLAPAVFELADELLLLGVDRDHRLLGVQARLDDRVEVRELGVAVWMPGALLGLHVGLQTEPHGAQQIADHRAVRAMSTLDQRIAEVAHAAADPQQRRLGVPARGVLDQRTQIDEQIGVLDDLRGATTARPTDPIGACSCSSSRSATPARIVLCASPVTRCTASIPPRPIARASAAAQTRLRRSSRNGASATKRV